MEAFITSFFIGLAFWFGRKSVAINAEYERQQQIRRNLCLEFFGCEPEEYVRQCKAAEREKSRAEWRKIWAESRAEWRKIWGAFRGGAHGL